MEGSTGERDVPDAGVIESSGPDEATKTLTIAEASRATGIARPSLRRHIDTNTFPGAFREATARGPHTGRWRIPVCDLVAVGYSLDCAALERSEVRQVERDIEVERLRVELAEERSRRIAAEALSEERARALEEARRALPTREVADNSLPKQPLPLQQRTPLRGNWLR